MLLLFQVLVRRDVYDFLCDRNALKKSSEL